MRDTNIPIRELQRYAALREQGEITSLERRKILEDHQSVVATQIEALEKAHAILTHKIANYRMIEEKLGLRGPAAQPVEMEHVSEPVAALAFSS
jgi:DNA-binding transcriptional MerR regulator